VLRKVVRAARTESELEGNRLAGALADELQAARARASGAAVPEPQAPAPAPAADHHTLVERLIAEREAQARAQQTGASDVPRRVELLWVHSTPTHAVWCERRHAATHAARGMTRDVICVGLVERGEITERWSFG